MFRSADIATRDDIFIVDSFYFDQPAFIARETPSFEPLVFNWRRKERQLLEFLQFRKLPPRLALSNLSCRGHL